MSNPGAEAIDLGGAQEDAAAIAELERRLAQLIDEVGELNKAKADAEQAIGPKRQAIEALMDKLDLTRHDGATYKATRKRRREKYIDPARLLKVVGQKRAAACVNVVLQKAEQELTTKQFGKLVEMRDGAVVLTVKALDAAE